MVKLGGCYCCCCCLFFSFFVQDLDRSNVGPIVRTKFIVRYLYQPEGGIFIM